MGQLKKIKGLYLFDGKQQILKKHINIFYEFGNIFSKLEIILKHFYYKYHLNITRWNIINKSIS